MTIVNANTIGAAPNRRGDWHSVDWRQCARHVLRLQARIVKATQQKRWNKVKALQHLFVHSYSAKVMAVKKVINNRGSKTPGVDKETWSTPKQKWEAVHTLKKHGYRPSPLRRIYIPKKNGEKRPLSIPTMRDRAMQALHSQALDPVAESLSDGHSYGFRKGRSTADAIQQCYIVLSRKCGAEWILEADIEKCFDNISHSWLLDHIPMDKSLLEKWLKAGFMDRKIWHKTDTGAAQGGILSPCLANMTLDGIGSMLSDRFPMKISSRKPAHKVNFVRYCDDFIVTGRSREILEQEVLPMIEAFLAERGLKLSKEKTKITHIHEGFDFLGQTIRKSNGKLFIMPSRKSVKAFLRAIRETVKQNRSARQQGLIQVLNPKIRGWCMYHRHVVSKKIFSQVRHELWQILWRWSKRRHPKEGTNWIKQKYFISTIRDNWCFACKVKRAKKDRTEDVIQEIFNPAKVAIKRHSKIRADANPYDPQWKMHFERHAKRRFKIHMQSWKLRWVLEDQNGKCSVCDLPITVDEDWDIHHKLPKSQGGDDERGNLILLHVNCHRHIHARKEKL